MVNHFIKQCLQFNIKLFLIKPIKIERTLFFQRFSEFTTMNRLKLKKNDEKKVLITTY